MRALLADDGEGTGGLSGVTSLIDSLAGTGIGVLTIAVVMVVLLYLALGSGYLVTRREHRELMRERDYWREAARTNGRAAEKVLEEVPSTIEEAATTMLQILGGLRHATGVGLDDSRVIAPARRVDSTDVEDGVVVDLPSRGGSP